MRFTLPCLCALVAGCDGQAGTGYRGEPLAILRGTVDNQRGAPPSVPIAAALLWRSSEGDEVMGASPVVIMKSFPADFTITIYLPAPPAVLAQATLPYAAANVGAVEEGATPAQLASGMGIVARLADPLLFYFSGDLPSTSRLAAHFGAVKRGYHLMSQLVTADPSTLAAADVDACAADLASQSQVAPGDAATECAQRLLSSTATEQPLDTPLLLQVSAP